MNRRRILKKKSKRPIGWLVLIALMLTFGMTVLGVGILIHTRFQREIPTELFHFSQNGQLPRFYIYEFDSRVDRDGVRRELPAGYFAQRQSSYVSDSRLPDLLKNAFIAIEDKRFYQHRGVDWYRTVAAGCNFVLGFSDSFGASTITQQLVKNVTGSSEVTLSRKMQEILYALDLERKMDKSEILERYLNVIHFSDRCEGIGDAAMHYFSKAPMELSAAECASLAAIANSPSYYNPIRHPENNLSRRNLILAAMRDQGYLDQEEYEAAVQTPLEIRETEMAGEGINSWYTDMVIEDVINDLMREHHLARAAASRLVLSGGLQIDIAMDPQIQNTVESFYRDSVQVPTNGEGVRAQSALIVLDSRTGDILGVAGAVGQKSANRVQNFATQTLRPPGSTIKPVTVYAPAIEHGIVNWATVYDDVPVRFDQAGKGVWPKNANGVYRGLTNVAHAVAHSTNTVAVKILEQVGIEQAYRMAKEQFHLHSLISDSRGNDCDLAALALGQLNYGVTLREMTNAYTVFADGGVYHPWRSYYRVTDGEGNLLLSSPDRGEVVVSEETAAIMTKLLQGVIEHGTTSAISLRKQTECAGKTGTTNQEEDRWFIGYTPDLVCGVWCGYEYPEPLSGKNICTDIWNRVMEQILKDSKGRKSFSVPSTVVHATYCKDSGKLLTDICSHDPRGDRSEVGWFVRGKEPHQYCDCHVLCQYDEEYGGISHGYCPEDCLRPVALIKISRRFPKQIYVADAQYAYEGDPMKMPPSPDPGYPYFSVCKRKFCGISAVTTPFHRSCTEHLPPTDLTSVTESSHEEFSASTE